MIGIDENLCQSNIVHMSFIRLYLCKPINVKKKRKSEKNKLHGKDIKLIDMVLLTKSDKIKFFRFIS